MDGYTMLQILGPVAPLGIPLCSSRQDIPGTRCGLGLNPGIDTLRCTLEASHPFDGTPNADAECKTLNINMDIRCLALSDGLPSSIF